MDAHIKEGKFKTDMAMKNANMVIWEYNVDERTFTAFNDPLTNYDETATYTPEQYIAALDPASIKNVEKAVAFMDCRELGEFSFKSKIMLSNTTQRAVEESCLSESHPTYRKPSRNINN